MKLRREEVLSQQNNTTKRKEREKTNIYIVRHFIDKKECQGVKKRKGEKGERGGGGW